MPATTRAKAGIGPVVTHPIRLAGVSALTYVILCGLYIVLSGLIASEIAATEAELQRIEILKGFGFVVVTGLLFFLISLLRWRKIHDQEQVIAAQTGALVEAERRNTAAMYAASMRHDLNNVLTALGGLLSEMESPDKNDKFMADMRRGVQAGTQRLQAFVARLAEHASDGLGTGRSRVVLSDALNEAAALLARHPDARECTVTGPADGDAVIQANRPFLDDCLVNLLLNAAQAIDKKGQIRVETRMDAHQGLEIVDITDDGCGIAPEDAGKLFEPFYSTKRTGTGLGLAVSYGIVRNHEGQILVASQLNEGTRITIELPLGRPMPPVSETKETRDGTAAHSHHR
jgi:two-component system sensor histidine kinase HydH